MPKFRDSPSSLGMGLGGEGLGLRSLGLGLRERAEF